MTRLTPEESDISVWERSQCQTPVLGYTYEQATTHSRATAYGHGGAPFICRITASQQVKIQPQGQAQGAEPA